MITCTRRLEIDAGHRLKDHPSRCRHVHGHRYGFSVTVGAQELDDCGRVVDFADIKALVGGWLDEKWDHAFLYQSGDHVGEWLSLAWPTTKEDESGAILGFRLFELPDAPTAENLARFVYHKASELLQGRGLVVVKVVCHETPNCSAEFPDLRTQLALGGTREPSGGCTP